jgi:DNA-binding response OmpR family regulator
MAARFGAEHVHMQLLLIEDERRFANLLARRLEGAGFDTTVAFTGIEGLDRATAAPWDLLVVDVMLPEMGGIEVVRTLRDRGSNLPILMLTARDTVEDRVTGLHAGADDYLVKPFAFAELLARLEALARRSGSAGHLSFGPVEMDVPAHRVRVRGEAVELTPKEFDLLECLLRGQGRAITRAEIKEYVWGFTFDAPTKVMDLYVHYVRRKLERAGAPGVIQTVRGIGYSIGR